MPFRAELGVVRHNRLVLALGASPLVVLAGLWLGSAVLGAVTVAVISPVLIALAVFLLTTVLVQRPWPRVVLTPVSASREELRVGARAWPRSAYRAGLAYRDEHRSLVRLEPKNRLRAPRLDLMVTDSEGEALLQALGLDALHATARFRTASGTWANMWAWTVGMVAAAFGAGAAMFLFGVGGAAPAVPLVFLLFVALTAWPSRVDVGADGVLTRWLWRRRFYRATDILQASAYVTAYGRSRIQGVELRLKSGETTRIPVASPFWDAGRTAMLATRINEVAWAQRERAEAGVALSLLERPEGATRTWIERLRALGTGANATHRTAPVAPETLWRVVEDATAEPRLRIAAAAALSASPEDGAKARLVSAAQATAEPRLRVALEATAAADEAAIAEALDELAPPPIVPVPHRAR